MGKHWEVGYLAGVECCGHVHLGKGLYPWVPQTPSNDCPTPIVGKEEV